MVRRRSSETSCPQDPNTPTALLAEDDVALRETMRHWLADEGEWAVREASHVETVVMKLDATVDVLVLEYWLPGLPDPDFGGQFAETSFDGRTVVLSANPSGCHRGTDDEVSYLTKPIEREDFIDELEETRQ